MRDDLTIIYYTSNKENPILEKNVQKYLLEISNGIPIISVSQQPIDFGIENICVGDVGASGHNAWRQFQMGIERAKTKYVCPAESDMLYPPQFFEFVPPTDDALYLAMPVWVLFAQRGKRKIYCLKPRGTEGAMIVARDFVLRRLEEMYKDLPMWGPLGEFISIMKRCKRDLFYLDDPIVTFKTDRNMHRKTPHIIHSKCTEIPYWGEAHQLLERFMK